VRSPHALWYHISYEMTAGIVVLYLAGYIHPLPIGSTYPPPKIYFLDSRPRRNRYGSLGSLTPEPLIVNNPIPPLHLTSKQLSVCLFLCHVTVSTFANSLDIRLSATTPHYQVGIVSPTPNADCCRPDPYSDNRDPHIVYHSLPPHLPIPTYSLENKLLLIHSLLGRGACAQCVR